MNQQANDQVQQDPTQVQGTPTNQSVAATTGDAFNTTQPDTQQSAGQVSGQVADQATLGAFASQMIGEGNPYKTVDDLAKGKREADAFIEQLKRENAEMREELGKRPTLDEVQEMLHLHKPTGEPQAPALDEEALSSIVQNQLSAIEQQRKQASNVELANSKMVELYGEKAGAQVAAKAQELGVTVDYLKNIAAQSPRMFFATMGIQPQGGSDSAQAAGLNQTGSTSPEASNVQVQGGQVNTEALASNPQGVREGTWSYYEQLRKSDPKKYFSPKVQNEIYKMRQKMQEDFYK